MAEPTIVAEVENSPTAPSGELARRRRILALSLVLLISLAHFVFAAFYYLVHPSVEADQHRRQLSLVSGLIAEATSLLLLWFVLSGQARKWKDIGWNLRWKDIPHGIGLLAADLLLSTEAALVFDAFYFGSSGHHLQVRNTYGILGAGVSVFSILFVLVNPFFEELIVRAYAMTEVIALGGSTTMAIVVSVILQMSYHVYQGPFRCIALAVTFTIFSIYFAKTRRIAPVILAHFCVDAYALFTLRA